jgi:hypothetical protein
VRLARHSLQTRKTGLAFSIMTQAHCGEHNLSDANATFQNVPPKLRGFVRHRCEMLGTTLGE